jgi:hypothetical protein
MFYLIKEKQHEGDNHGALYSVSEDFDMDGESLGFVAKFTGNVICPSLGLYLAENPDVIVADNLPDLNAVN